MDRIELATRLDANYLYQRHVYDLTRKFYLLGRDRLIANLQPEPGHSVLEIGCGTGRNLILAYGRYPDAEFFGLDLSSAMLRTADAKIASVGLSKRIHLSEGDAASFDAIKLFGRAKFDRIVYSFSLSMIPQWQQALDHAIDCLSVGGEIHIVDFGTGRELPSWANSTLRKWLGNFHVTPRDTLLPHLEMLAARYDLTLAANQPFRNYSVLAALSSRGR
jgi:S-adenosylmethionine-diacylgycerolhomoserine-N-methlytransferase